MQNNLEKQIQRSKKKTSRYQLQKREKLNFFFFPRRSMNEREPENPSQSVIQLNPNSDQLFGDNHIAFFGDFDGFYRQIH